MVAVIGLAACDQKPVVQPSGRTVKIGIVAPFTGTDRAKGNEGLKGIHTAMQLMPYLQNGDAIKLVLEDDGNDSVRSVKALKKLAATDKVSAILTLSSSGPVLKMADVADDYKTPILALLATHPDITRNNHFISQFPFDDDFQGTVAAQYVRDELLMDRAAVVINPESAHSRHLGAKFAQEFQTLGGRTTNMVSLSGDTDDYESVVKRVRRKNPELVYLPIRAKAVIRLVQIAGKMDWHPQAMVGDGLLSTVLTKYRKEARLLDGLLASDFYAHQAPLSAYGKRLKSAYKGNATTYTALGMEGYALLVNALNRCRDPADRACINRMIRSTRNFTGLMGRISIESDGKARRPLFVNAIHDGHMKYVVKVY